MTYSEVVEHRQQTFAQNAVRWARFQVRVGKHWRLDAWDVIMEGLQEVGTAMREAGPVASAYYATILQLAIEYLTAKPNTDRAHELKGLLADDYARFLKYAEFFRPAQLNDTERKLLSDARFAFTVATLRIEQLCSDTS